MRNAVAICISLLMAGIVCAAAQSSELGLAAAWLFDEGSGNETRNSLGSSHGELMGDLGWTDGQFGKAIEFPGQGDSYVSIAHDDIMDSDPYTITAWVKLESTTWQYIAWRNGTVWPEPHKKRHTDIWVFDGSNIVVIMWHTEAAFEGRVDGTTVVADGTWHHVAKSSDGETMRLFIDGNLDGEAPTEGTLAINGEDPLWIGARPGDVAATGIIDEVGFFTQALSEDELQTVMNDGLAVLAPVEPLGKMAATWGKLKNGS